MSALEELWLWLQGRSSRTEEGSDSMQAGELHRNDTAAVNKEWTADAEVRIEKNWRYRAGPWQMK